MSIYQGTYDGLRVKIGAHAVDSLVARSGAELLGPNLIGLRCVGRDYTIAHPEGVVLDAEGQPAEVGVAILLLLYLLEATGGPQEGRWISFEQLPGGPGYLASFRGRVVSPILRAFGPDPSLLLEAGRELGGEPLGQGDVSVCIPALPRVPVAYLMWKGDEEFAPSVSVVFDSSVRGYLDAEVLTALAEHTTRRLVAAVNRIRKEGDSGDR